mgnify:CR=1 FL=1
MIEVENVDVALQQISQCSGVNVQRDIAHRHRIARLGTHAPQQIDFALWPGDERGLNRIRQAQLVQRADAVRVAIKNVYSGRARGC